MKKSSETIVISGMMNIRAIGENRELIQQRMDFFLRQLTQIGYRNFGEEFMLKVTRQNHNTTYLVEIKYPQILAQKVNMIEYKEIED